MIKDRLMKINTRNLYQALFCMLIVAMTSCSSDMRSSLDPVESAFGQANSIVVIADKNVWEGPIGDTFQYYFEGAYPILPQPEPLFDLKHFTPEDLRAEPIRKRKRTYVVLGDIDDEDSSTGQLLRTDLGDQNVSRAAKEKSFNTTMGKNRWAHGQTVVYLFGSNEQELTKNIKDKFPAIAKRINTADQQMIKENAYSRGVDNKLSNDIKEALGVEIDVPGDYVLAIHDENTIWLRSETDFLSSNIFLQKLPYKDKSQFTQEGMKAIRDSIGRKYVSTEIENTYMRTNDVDLPMLTKVITLNDNYAMEARGIWDIVNDYMGGPFLSYLVHNTSTNELLFIDGFVHAPGKKKRNYMQHLEEIFSTVKF